MYLYNFPFKVLHISYHIFALINSTNKIIIIINVQDM